MGNKNGFALITVIGIIILVVAVGFGFYHFRNLNILSNTSTSNVVIGEDKDGDGVWDYIQTYINKTYPNSERVRASLRQVAKAMQNFMLDYKGKSFALKKHAKELLVAIDCASNFQGKNNSAVINDLKSKILNTPARSDAYSRANQNIQGELLEQDWNINDVGNCDFNPDIMPN